MPPFIIDKIIEKTVAAPCILSSVSIANESAVDCTSIYQGFQYGSMKSVNFTSDDHIITKGQWNYYGLLAAKLNLAGDTIWQKRLVKPSSMGFLQSFPTQDGIAICYSYNSGMHILRLSNAGNIISDAPCPSFPNTAITSFRELPGDEIMILANEETGAGDVQIKVYIRPMPPLILFRNTVMEILVNMKPLPI